MNYAIAGSFSLMALALSMVINNDGGILFALGLLLGAAIPFFLDLFLN